MLNQVAQDFRSKNNEDNENQISFFKSYSNTVYISGNFFGGDEIICGLCERVISALSNYLVS